MSGASIQVVAFFAGFTCLISAIIARPFGIPANLPPCRDYAVSENLIRTTWRMFHYDRNVVFSVTQ